MEPLEEALARLSPLPLLCSEWAVHPCGNRAVVAVGNTLCARCAINYAQTGPAYRTRIERAIQFRQDYPEAVQPCCSCWKPASHWCVIDGMPICPDHAWYSSQHHGYVCTKWCAPTLRPAD